MSMEGRFLEAMRKHFGRQFRNTAPEYGTVISETPLVVQLDLDEKIQLTYEDGDFTINERTVLKYGDRVVLSETRDPHKYVVHHKVAKTPLDLRNIMYIADGIVGQVLRVISATEAAFQTLLHDDLGSVGTDNHHPMVHTHTGGGTGGGLINHDDLGGRTTDNHHAEVHALSGTDHSGTLAATQFSDVAHGVRTTANAHAHGNLSGIGANDHHNQAHSISGADHTGSLSAGQFSDTAHGSRGTIANAHAVADITGAVGLNVVNTFTKQYASQRYNVTFSATPTFDWNNGNVQSMTLTGNITSMTLSNPIDGGRYLMRLTQDATGGRTVAWPASVHWPGGTAPTLSALNKTDLISLLYDGGLGFYLASIVGNY